MRRNVGGLKEQERPLADSQQGSGDFSLKTTDMNSTSILNELGSRFFPEPPDKIPTWLTSWVQPCETLSIEPSTAWTWGGQNCEVIKGCCFKLLSLG